MTINGGEVTALHDGMNSYDIGKGYGYTAVTVTMKLVALTITILAAWSWMSGELVLYTQEIFKNFAFVAR